ncbi:MAG: UDP-3-O-acyl-N-acetylglucosamine deacetylase [Chlamydiae bacterium]|nr:UDP-3-O-acyl-N-acetylglucosamine deacetylase [Chlamydiota bacterium]
MPETVPRVAEKPIIGERCQNTLSVKRTFTGVGIHTGHQVNLTFCPAAPGTGIVFQRVDLPSKPMIPATVDYVLDASSRNTTIGIDAVKVHTIEHVLAALSAYQIDNLVIQVDGPEPPVGDGSSSVFVKMIEDAGVEPQTTLRSIFKIREPIFYSKNNIHIVALPADELKISYTLHYPQISSIGSQYHSIVVSSDSFKKELSECRTFALYRELKMLMDAGLIKGGSLDNAVVVHEEAIFSNGGLKFANEMVRHKILDMLGDLSLVGFSLQAHIISICSGHATNVAFAKKLLKNITMENI